MCERRRICRFKSIVTLPCNRNYFIPVRDSVWKDGDEKAKVRVNYLNIPILAKLYVLEGLSVDLGPQLGFALNAKNKLKSGGTTVKNKITNFNTCDVSFAVGLSYEYEEFMVSAVIISV